MISYDICLSVPDLLHSVWQSRSIWKKESESCSVVFSSLHPHGLYSPWTSPGQNTAVGSLSLLQGISPTQGWNPGLPHYRWILYQLSHQGNPRILEWVAYPFSRGSSWPRNWTGASCIARWVLYQLSYQGSPPRSIYVTANGIFCSFLWLSNTPLYFCTMSSLSIPLLLSI